MDVKDQMKQKITLFWYTTGIPVRLFDSDFHLLHENILDSQKEHFSQIDETLLRVLRMDEQTIHIQSDSLFRQYLYYPFQLNFTTHYIVLCGPCIEQNYTAQLLSILLPKEHFTPTKLNDHLQYLHSLPHYSYAGLMRVKPLLDYLLLGNLTLTTDTSPVTNPKDETNTDAQDMTMPTSSSYHHSFLQTRDIQDAIVHMDKKRLLEVLTRPMDGSFGVLSVNNPLRAYKNLFISSITEATNTVIQCGVDTESAYTLSDHYIQLLEITNDHDQITKMFLTMYYHFIDLLKQYNKTRYTKAVYLVIDYLKKHYSETIRIHDLSSLTNFSEVHLCRLFKQETGSNIHDYLLNLRLTQVKHLLKGSNETIAKIALQTGFSDQSHLTRIFKKHMGTTPLSFRKYYQEVI